MAFVVRDAQLDLIRADAERRLLRRLAALAPVPDAGDDWARQVLSRARQNGFGEPADVLEFARCCLDFSDGWETAPAVQVWLWSPVIDAQTRWREARAAAGV